VAGVERADLWMRIQMSDDLLHRKGGLGGLVERGEDLGDQLKVPLVVQGQTVGGRQVASGWPDDVAEEEPVRLIPDERRRVLSLEAPGRQAPGLLEDVDADDFDVVAVGPGRRMQVADEGQARVVAPKVPDDEVDGPRIDEGTVGRNLHQGVGVAGTRDLQMAVEQIGGVTGQTEDPEVGRQRANRFVLGERGRRDHELVQLPSGGDPLQHPREHWAAQNRQENLAGEARRTGARLDDPDDLHRALISYGNSPRSAETDRYQCGNMTSC
jgi:hypothetical protein